MDERRAKYQIGTARPRLRPNPYLLACPVCFPGTSVVLETRSRTCSSNHCMLPCRLFGFLQLLVAAEFLRFGLLDRLIDDVLSLSLRSSWLLLPWLPLGPVDPPVLE